MYTFSVIRPRSDEWWVVAISWEDQELWTGDEELADIVGMDLGKMRTEIVRYYGAELYENGGTYWNSEFEAKKAIQLFFQPRMLAQILVNDNKIQEEKYV